MLPEELMIRYGMRPHEENGAFAESHYVSEGAERAASGSIYYYVAPNERTEFHRIDCDEYWIYTAGSSLEIWMISPEGSLSIQCLGVTPNSNPKVYVPKGTVFASRHIKTADCESSSAEGTFLVCITVPRFTYEGFTLFTRKEVTDLCPEVSDFYE